MTTDNTKAKILVAAFAKAVIKKEQAQELMNTAYLHSVDAALNNHPGSNLEQQEIVNKLDQAVTNFQKASKKYEQLKQKLVVQLTN